MGSDKVDILFSTGQGEIYSPANGFKLLAKRLQDKWSIATSKDIFSGNSFSRTRLILLLGPQRHLSSDESEQLSNYVKNGGYLLLAGEGFPEEASYKAFLERYGIQVEKFAVIRNAFSKYFTPKEALISDGYLQRISSQKSETATNQGSILFPYGNTLGVRKPSVPLLTTGAACVPMHRPICGLYHDPKGGRVMVIGSTLIFHDNYIDKEANFTLVDRLISLIMSEKLPRILPDESDVPDNEAFSDIGSSSVLIAPLCDNIKALAKQPEKIFDNSFNHFGLSGMAEVLNAYKELKIPSEQLALIAPKCENTLPPLLPAVYPPAFDDLARPELEMYDFNLEFASERDRLTNIFKEALPNNNLDRYLAEVGNALAVESNGTTPSTTKDPKQMLQQIATDIVTFKKAAWMA